MPQTSGTYGCDTSDMHIPHDLLRKAMKSPEAVLGRVPRGDVEREQEVALYYSTVLTFLHAHHRSEDELLWPRLRDRAPQHVELYERMEAEHLGISTACDAAQTAATAYAAGPGEATTAELASAITALRHEVEQHLSEEEREILPIAAVTMTQQEWGELPAHAMAQLPPEHLWLVLGLVLDHATATERQMIGGMLPDPVRAVWESEGRQKYETFMASVRGVD